MFVREHRCPLKLIPRNMIGKDSKRANIVAVVIRDPMPPEVTTKSYLEARRRLASTLGGP
jgi:hypothetical protein